MKKHFFTIFVVLLLQNIIFANDFNVIKSLEKDNFYKIKAGIYSNNIAIGITNYILNEFYNCYFFQDNYNFFSQEDSKDLILFIQGQIEENKRNFKEEGIEAFIWNWLYDNKGKTFWPITKYNEDEKLYTIIFDCTRVNSTEVIAFYYENLRIEAKLPPINSELKDLIIFDVNPVENTKLYDYSSVRVLIPSSFSLSEKDIKFIAKRLYIDSKDDLSLLSPYDIGGYIASYIYDLKDTFPDNKMIDLDEKGNYIFILK